MCLPPQNRKERQHEECDHQDDSEQYEDPSGFLVGSEDYWHRPYHHDSSAAHWSRAPCRPQKGNDKSQYSDSESGKNEKQSDAEDEVVRQVRVELTVSRTDIGLTGPNAWVWEPSWELLNQMTRSTRELQARELGRVKEGWKYFAERANELPKAREMISGWDRVVQFSLDGEEPFYLTFSNGAVAFSDGTHGKPDLILKGTEDVFYRLMIGELDRIRAFMFGQFKFSGSLEDAAKFADIGDAVRRSVKFPP